MNLIVKLMQGLTGTGAHRAADRIPVLEAERDRWKRLAAAWQEQTTHADRLVTKVCAEKSAALFEGARLAAELDIVAEAHQLLEQENDELAARLTEVSAELANTHTVSSPAPADHGPAIRWLDPDSTAEINVTTLWDGKGLRLNKQTAA